MNNKSNKNTLLINGQAEIAALSDLWQELEKQGWSFFTLNPKKAKLNLPSGRFMPLPQASSKFKLLFVLILWPWWLLFYLVIFSYYKYKKKISFIINFNATDLLILTPIAKVLKLKIISLLGPHSVESFTGLKSKKHYLRAAKNIQTMVMCEESKKHLSESGIAEKNIKILNPGIRAKGGQHQSDIFSSLAQADKEKSNKKFFSVGTVIELNNKQNIELLFQAAKKCLTVIPHLQIVIIGDGEERKNLTWLAKRLNIANLVWFVGEQKHLKKWLDNIDVYVTTCSLANINDMNNTLYAAASALPIISMQNIGLNDIIKDDISGRMIQKDDNEKLAQAIISLYKDKRACRRLGQAAQKQTEEKFLLDHTLNNYISIINSK